MAETGSLVVADDQPDLLSLMKDALEFEGYDVRTAENGREAVDLVKEREPDIVILDLFMPVKDGFAACKELKSDPRYGNLPVILLSAANEKEKRIQGMDLGADDFLLKPIDLSELLARIRMILRRTRQGLDANPLTRLPGNASIQNRIMKPILDHRPVAVLYCDLNEFKAYNDVYGFEAGDKVIKETGRILAEVVRDKGAPDDFLGHIGGDDFIIVTVPERMEELAEEVIRRYDEAAPSFYNEEDRSRGKIVAKDRKGRTQEYPISSIAIGVCHNRLKPLESYAQVSSIGAELKKHAKREPGSRCEIDRRKD